jgi:cobalt/nickel transport system permease protein
MTLALDLLPNPDSPLRRRDARWKLAAVVVAVAAAAMVQALPAAAAALAGAVFLAILGRVPLRWYIARLGAMAPFFIAFVILVPCLVSDAEPLWRLGPLTVYAKGLRLAVLVCLKALAIMTLLAVLLTAAPLPETLQAAHRLRVPGLLVQLTLLTYRYVFLLANELARIRVAVRVRGYRNRPTLHSYRTVAHVAGTLLVRGHERAERVGQAMRARGFDGRFRALTAFRTAPADVALFAAIVAGAAAVTAWDFLIRQP